MIRLIPLCGLTIVALAVSAGPAPGRTLKVDWMQGYPAPGTPARLDKVGVIKVGSPKAPNVLVLEPGTSAGSTYFLPLARWIVAQAPAWQVWSVERRENLLEDHSVLDLAKRHRATGKQLFDYYLGYLVDPSIRHHFRGISASGFAFAKQWGMEVAVQDLHRVIAAARRLGGRVLLGGHALGGTVVTAYAIWNFSGRAGARDLAGLVYIDGASRGSESAAAARARLASLESPSASPWLSFGTRTTTRPARIRATCSSPTC